MKQALNISIKHKYNSEIEMTHTNINVESKSSQNTSRIRAFLTPLGGVNQWRAKLNQPGDSGDDVKRIPRWPQYVQNRHLNEGS